MEQSHSCHPRASDLLPSGLFSMLYHILRAAGDAVFPAKCRACGAFFHPEKLTPFATCGPEGKKNMLTAGAGNRLFEMLLSPHLCDACVSGYAAIAPPFCTVCGNVFKSREGENHVCGECLTVPKHFSAARAAGVNNGALLALIHRLKYSGRTELAKPLGLLLFSAFITAYGNSDVDLMIPVPLHITRFRERGFNQAYLLIRNWQMISKESGVNMKTVPVNITALTRTRKTASQTGLGRDKRLANIKRAFTVQDADAVQGKRILLVDDVYTTGATVNECANVLLKSGATRVHVLTLARGVQA